ncbi:MAG: DHH family phosphoesterase [Clostridiales Family XIII bacterium]|jgi:c-di-AMP phosphodiesterase-like protein|nr:DHH family phosphoesterase [Clostridiales Family XIII bacterium]
MNDRMLTKIVTPYIIFAAILFAPGLIFLFSRGNLLPPYYASTLHPADYILEACAAAFIILCVVTRIRQKRLLAGFIAGVESDVEDMVKYSVRNYPLPICVVNSEGRLVLTNDRFKEYFPSARILKTDIKDVIGLSRNEIEPAGVGSVNIRDGVGETVPGAGNVGISISAGGRSWLTLASYLNEDVSKSVMLHFIDVTDYEALKGKYADEKQCFCYVVIDNYDDILSKSKDEKRPAIAASIETAILEWGAGMGAIVLRHAKDRFHLIFDTTHFKEVEAGKFSILEEIRKTYTDAEFPVSLSIGVGAGGATLSQTEEYAAFAIDLALGRGGDQAVVKSGDDVRYYGGTVQVIENRNRGKSRVMAHALKQHMARSSNVMIMGHRNMDMDSLGSALGANRIAFANGKDVHIVRGEIDPSMRDVFAAASKSGYCHFVSCEDAVKSTGADTLLIVVDCHTPGMVECPNLIDLAGRVVIIDHHRKMENFIVDAALTFMDPGASSTSELVAEIMQYDDKVGKIEKIEANLMLAGIFVDTNNFSVKTGTRTFDAARWLRENGADSMTVREYLQSDMRDFRQRANIISNADFTMSGIAISRNEGVHANAQTIVAQAADELLDIKGIRASFVVGETKNEVVVSARSLGSINVHAIMERIGGGGHLTMAAAQIPGASQDEVVERIKELIEEFDNHDKN